MRARAAALALSACLGLGCASGPAPLPTRPKSPPPLPPGRQAVETCYNLEYGFTCVPPPGFLITSEGPGPGQIMTLVKRSHTSSEEANLTVRVHTLRADNKLKWLVKDRVLAPLKDASGVKRLESKESTLGMREGVEVRVEREYATGLFYTRVFCFERGGNAYIVEYTSPATRDSGPDALESFVNSIAFR